MSDLDIDGDGMLNTDEQSFANVDLNTDGSAESTDDGMYYDAHGNAYDENPYLDDGSRVYLDSDGNVYTQDQIGGWVDGSEYGDIYMVDGQEVLLEQGTMINGRMMFDGDGDGRFDVVYNDKGNVLAQYDPELKDWVDHNGNTSASIGDYMNSIDPLTGASGSGIENPFNMSKEAYEAMTGEQYVDDLFALKATEGGSGTDGMLLALDDGEIAEMVARFERDPYVDPNTNEVLSGAEGLERYLQNNNIGVNHSSEHGWRLESGVDTSDGIYGTMSDSANVADFEGAPDTTKDSTVRTIADIAPNDPIDDDPFTDPPEPEEIIKEIEDKYSASPESGGNDGAQGDTTTDTSGSNSTDSEASTPGSASAGGASASAADAAALAAAYAAAGLVNPHEGTGSPLDPRANPVDPVDPSTETSDLPSDTTADNTTDTTGTGNGTTTGSTPGETTSDTTGTTAPGETGNNTSNVTDDTGTSTGDSTAGTGETGDSTEGSGTTGDDTGSTGTGTTGDTGNTSTGTNPTGSTAGTGPTFGTAEEGPGGPGNGDGFGLGDGGSGMMSGSSYTPSWGELFAYTTLTPYQKRQLEPMKDAIVEAKGYLA
jgi:hypothetical protein